MARKMRVNYINSDAEAAGCLLIGLGAVGIFLVFSLAGVAIGGLVIKLLWNWLAPLFWSAAPALTFWQGAGIALLLSLVGGFFGRSGSK